MVISRKIGLALDKFRKFPTSYLEERDQWFYLNQSKAQTTIYDYQEEEWFEPDTPITISGI